MIWAQIIKKIFLETLKIVGIVTVLMIIIEWFQIRYEERIKKILTKNPHNQIIGSSLLGAIPGCIDAFLVVSLYSHGLVGFGALNAVMLSTAGDEAFVMLATIPKTALIIFTICAALGIIGGYIVEKISSKINLKRSEPCTIEIHAEEYNIKHFLKEHVYEHILKKHILRLFLWIFFTLLIIDFLMQYFDIESILPENRLLLIFLAALIGIIPESGPHLIFLTLYSKGLIPFSVLLVSTLSQDGHGLLPLLSYSFKDTIKVQIFTTIFSLLVGLILYLIGI
jgi:hypothetical protein